MKITFLEYVLAIAVGFMLGASFQSALYAKQPKRYIDTIIVHHSGNKENYDVSAEEIDTYHKSEGWKGFGYHYLIRRNGEVEEGRELSKIGAHAKHRNKFSIGICLSGNTATRKQIKTLYKLCKKLRGICPYLKSIERHRKNTEKNPCPGPSVNVEHLAEDILGGGE